MNSIFVYVYIYIRDVYIHIVTYIYCDYTIINNHRENKSFHTYKSVTYRTGGCVEDSYTLGNVRTQKITVLRKIDTHNNVSKTISR